ncbi:corrinoid adenosyltransferase MMAB-like [Lycorma delicatula]|uniref:corrinoid adenosyltransferase MMAB-like n=1 Tax=Lycorma delicatula TaxID=130591 RepID=UPI003F514380
MYQIKFMNGMNCFTKIIRSSLFITNVNLSKYCYSTVDKDVVKEVVVKNDKIIQNKEAENNLPTPIYSRKGDFGETEVNGIILSKNDKIFKAIGTTDELSSQLGFAKEFGRQHNYGDKLLRIQMLLVNVMTAIQKSHFQTGKEKVPFSPTYTKELEDWIDEYSHQLPPVEHYVLPGGGIASSSLHVARSVCRRAERNVIPLVQDGVIDKEILAYLNRLSDFLFTISRIACKMDKQDEYTTSAHHDTPKDQNFNNN